MFNVSHVGADGVTTKVESMDLPWGLDFSTLNLNKTKEMNQWKK